MVLSVWYILYERHERSTSGDAFTSPSPTCLTPWGSKCHFWTSFPAGGRREGEGGGGGKKTRPSSVEGYRSVTREEIDRRLAVEEWGAVERSRRGVKPSEADDASNRTILQEAHEVRAGSAVCAEPDRVQSSTHTPSKGPHQSTSSICSSMRYREVS